MIGHWWNKESLNLQSRFPSSWPAPLSIEYPNKKSIYVESKKMVLTNYN